MNMRQARFEARGIVFNLLESYFDVGQPKAGCADDNHPDDDSCERCEKIDKALREIQERMRR